MTQVWQVKLGKDCLGKEDVALFVVMNGKGWLVRESRVKENIHLSPPKNWQSTAVHVDNSLACGAVAAINQKLEADVEQQIASGKRMIQQEYATRWPYVVCVGRYSIPRVFRMETDKKSNRRGRIYNRVINGWGKTLRPVGGRIVGVMGEQEFEIWRDTGRSVWLCARSVDSLAGNFQGSGSL